MNTRTFTTMPLDEAFKIIIKLKAYAYEDSRMVTISNTENDYTYIKILTEQNDIMTSFREQLTSLEIGTTPMNDNNYHTEDVIEFDFNQNIAVITTNVWHWNT